MKLTIETQSNYLAKLVEIKERDFYPHSNADRLKMVKVDYNNVITGIDAKPGIYVYFPVECAIAEKFLSLNNLYRENQLNVDDSITGYIEKSSRVKAMKLRGEYSQGMIMPIESLKCFI